MNIYFKEPCLDLSAGGDIFVRSVSRLSYVLIVAITVVFFFSDLEALRWLSIVFLFFTLDRVIHLGEGEIALRELKGENVNIAMALTPRAHAFLNAAFRRSLAVSEDFSLVLLSFLASERDTKEVLKRLDVSPKEFAAKITDFVSRDVLPANRADLLSNLEDVARGAYVVALETNEKFIHPRNLLLGLYKNKYPAVYRIFGLFNIRFEDLKEALLFGRYAKSMAGIRRVPAHLGGFAHRPRRLRHRVMNRAWTARPTPTLDEFSEDLTDLAREEKIGLLIGHEKEFSDLLSIISRPGKPNAILVGEPGSGKSTIMAHLAFRMIKDDVPSVLFDKRLVSLEITELLGNAPPEILASRIQKIFNEIVLAGNIVLFIPNIHDLFRTAQAKSLSAIDLLLPLVRNSAIPLIGETYPREFKQYIEPRTDFLDQFDVVRVEEINEGEAIRFLAYYSLILEKEFGVYITFRAVGSAVRLAHRYFRGRPLPGSAVDLLKRAAGRATQIRTKIIDEKVIIALAEETSKIPIEAAGGAEAEKLLNLEVLIHERLVNQETAARAVSRALREYRSGLSRKGGPIATFLFVGPTGVGKTELSKILADIQFGSKEAMRRFDMSEYQEKSSISRLIGASDGERTGALTDAILENPYSLLLLDELEKAHPDILNLFLQVFDDGRLTDSLGRTVTFENTIIIATSNAHSDFIKSEVEAGRKMEEIGEELKKKLTDYFKPELLNRFSDVIVFRSLNPDEIAAIAKLLLGDVSRLVEEVHGITLSYTDEAIRKIAEMGFSSIFGARPLRQVISERVRGVLAEKILKKEIDRGNKIELILDNGNFQFKITE